MSEPLELHLSTLDDWRGCGKRFELSTLRRVAPLWRHPAALNGTAIHRLIEAVHAEELWDAPRADMAELYAAAFHFAVECPTYEHERGVPVWWGKAQDERGGMAEYAADALEMIDGYRADIRNRAARLVLSEARWRADMAGHRWAGMLDQARELGDGAVELVDLKSGRTRLADVPLRLWGQGLGYAIALGHAEFMPMEHAAAEPWRSFELKVSRVTWLQLRDYVPYLKGGRRSDGTSYVKGDLRGRAHYSVAVTPETLRAQAEEMRLFAEAIAAGRFERRPSNYQCGMCRVQEACLTQFYGTLDEETVRSLRVTVEDYGEEQ